MAPLKILTCAQDGGTGHPNRFLSSGRRVFCLLALWMSTMSCSSALVAPQQNGQVQMALLAPASLLQIKITGIAGEKIEYSNLLVASDPLRNRVDMLIRNEPKDKNTHELKHTSIDGRGHMLITSTYLFTVPM
jgi:hypothetical protein